MPAIDFESEEYRTYLADVETDQLGTIGSAFYLPTLIEWLPQKDYNTISILEIGASIFSAYDWFIEKYGRPINGMNLGTYPLQHQNGSVHCKPWTEEKRKHFQCPLDAHKLLDFYKPESYDLVLAFHSFEHMIDLPLVLKNCYEVLKRNGNLFCSLPCPSRNFHKGHWYDIKDSNEMRKLGEKAGFMWIKGIEIKDLRFRPESEMICLFLKS